MGDHHRVTNLSYGHLGEASYRPDEQDWSFSRDVVAGKLLLARSTPNTESSIRRLNPSYSTFEATYTSNPSTSPKRDRDSVRRNTLTKKMAGEDTARGYTCRGPALVFGKDSKRDQPSAIGIAGKW